ncbi:hypothetical protein M8C21_027624 [Ambrosia artemisiifolia]|uniref:Uncharacterized protein n=1 Tax=Ambrosia artemisiifolia TaxID=4212 RepID=A0AAD5BWF4_AMBAR|nr:hypothetical protein M8C21_027624 [Ambrosia artemisiifolia]
MGLKLHEDWGTTPANIDDCFVVAEQYYIQKVKWVLAHVEFNISLLSILTPMKLYSYMIEGTPFGQGQQKEDYLVKLDSKKLDYTPLGFGFYILPSKA